jgi:hypothetical protein
MSDAGEREIREACGRADAPDAAIWEVTNVDLADALCALRRVLRDDLRAEREVPEGWTRMAHYFGPNDGELVEWADPWWRARAGGRDIGLFNTVAEAAAAVAKARGDG